MTKDFTYLCLDLEVFADLLRACVNLWWVFVVMLVFFVLVTFLTSVATLIAVYPGCWYLGNWMYIRWSIDRKATLSWQKCSTSVGAYHWSSWNTFTRYHFQSMLNCIIYIFFLIFIETFYSHILSYIVLMVSLDFLFLLN